MLVSSIMSRVRNLAGDTSALQFTDAMLVDWINDGVRECAIQNLLLQKRATTVVSLGQGDYSLPTDILKIHSVKYDGNKLRLLTLEEFDAYTGGEGTESEVGVPTIAYIWAGSLNLYPVPDNSSSAVSIDYIYNPVEVSISSLDVELSSLPIQYHSRIVDYCLAQVAQQDDDMPRYQTKMLEFSTGISQIKDHSETQEDLYPFISVSSRDSGHWEAGDEYSW